MEKNEVYLSFLGTFRAPKRKAPRCWNGETQRYEFPEIPEGFGYSKNDTIKFEEILKPLKEIKISVYINNKHNYKLLIVEFGETVEAAYVYPPQRRHEDSCCTEQPHGSYLREW